MENGLTQKEAAKKLSEHGPNEIAKKKRVSDLQLLLFQLKSPLIYVLIAAMGITGGVLHDAEDTIVIGLAVVFNTFLGFFQERKANRSLEALAAVLSPHAKVKRDGVWQDVDAKNIVPGDILRLELGVRVAADGEASLVNSLSVNEAVLTGESAAVEKKVTDTIFMGTTIAGGIGEMMVTKTGQDTEFGKIAESLSETKSEDTPLQAQIGRFAKMMAIGVGIISLLVLLLGLYVGDSFREIFPTAVALAVAAIPEGLAVSLTVILAIGMQRIFKKKALVRKLVAAETLGGVTVICADKTGTLTEGKMIVVEVLESISPDEKVRKMKKDLLVTAALLVNDMRDPLEIAMRDWAHQQLHNSGGQAQLEKQYPRLSSIPFDPKWRYIATLNRWGKDKNMILVSGAPEEVLERCNTTLARRKEWGQKFEAEAKKGHRLVGFAYKEMSQRHSDTVTHKDVKDLRWLGSLVYDDPIRESVKDSLQKVKEAGIKITVITGDYAPTAAAIMKKLSLIGENEEGVVMEGKELKQLTDEELKRKIMKIKLFARTTPDQKLKIVQVLQSMGEVVAMTGDGVNDAPALKKADIGIVVNEASDVSKETADMVLLDSNFATILAAIEGGRMIKDNLRKVILYLLADSFAEILIVMMSLVVRVPLPITAAMILWINLVSDGFPDLALTVDPADKDLLKRPPEPRQKHLIDGEMGLLIALISITSAVIGFAAFWFYWQHQAYGLEHARTVAFSLLGLNSLFYVWSARSLKKPLWEEGFLKNPWLVGAVLLGFSLHLLGIYTDWGQRLLGTVAIDWSEWLVVIMGSLIMMVVVEGVKWSYNRKT
jgi:Ca2+-transporting ATPase